MAPKAITFMAPKAINHILAPPKHLWVAERERELAHQPLRSENPYYKFPGHAPEPSHLLP